MPAISVGGGVGVEDVGVEVLEKLEIEGDGVAAAGVEVGTCRAKGAIPRSFRTLRKERE